MQHKLSKRLLLIPLMLVFLCSAALAVAVAPAKDALAEDNVQTYNISGKFDPYSNDASAGWSSVAEAISGTATEVILRPDTATMEGGDGFRLGNSALTMNNSDGAGGWNLDGLTMNFYLGSKPGAADYLRVYFTNNTGWYNTATAGFGFYIRSIADGQAQLLIFRKTALGELNHVHTVAIPINNDYDYWTDTKEAGVEPVTGTLNTWHFYFGKGVEAENDVYGHFYGVFNGTVIDFYDTLQADTYGGDIFALFDDFEMGEKVSFAAWFPSDGLATGSISRDNGWAMRITEVTSTVSTASNMLPYGYADESEDASVLAGYTNLGYPYFTTGAANAYAIAVRNTATASLGNAVTTFALDGINLSDGAVFTQSFKAIDNAEFSFAFTKAGAAAASLTVTSDGTEVVSGVSVPFTWAGMDGNWRYYNTFSIAEAAGSYTVSLNGNAITGLSDAIGDFISAHGDAQIGFALDTESACQLVIKSIVSQPSEVLDSYPGYTVVMGESMVITENSDGYPVFYNAEAEQYLVSNTETEVTPDSFAVDLSLAKTGTTDTPFLVGVASPAQAMTWVAVQITYVNESQAQLALALIEGENVTLIGESEVVDFTWASGTYNYLAVITVNGETTVMLNYANVIRVGYSEELETFKDTYFTEAATLDFVSMGDARTLFSVAGISDLVEMGDPAPGWSPGARPQNATFVYGTDGAIGIMHDGTNSQMYNAPIAPEGIRLSVYSSNFTGGSITLGLQSSSDNGQWFTTAASAGLVFNISRDVMETDEAGEGYLSQDKVYIAVNYNAIGQTADTRLLEKTAIDWTDGEEVTIYLQKAEDGSWMLVCNGTDILASLDEEAKAAFDAGVDAFAASLTNNAGYFLAYADGVPSGFVLYYNSVCTGTPSISGAPSILAVGETAQLTAQISPAMGVSDGTWASSDGEIVTVDENGLITAVANGTAEITFTTVDGAVARVTVTVGSAPQSAVINGAPETLAVGEYVQLTSTVTPAEAAQTGTWSSSDTDIATVDSTGRVTGVAAGTVTITFTTTDGNVTASVDIEITGGTSTGGGCNGCGGTVGTGVAGLSVLLLAAAALLVVRKVKN